MRTDEIDLFNSKGENYVTVFYDSELSATVDKWVGEFETKENFISGLNLVLTNIQRNQSRKWLADLSMIHGDFSFVREYIPRDIIPKARKAGLRYEALVLPHNIFSILSVQTVLEDFSGIEFQLFDNVQQAKEWLNSKM